MLVTRGVDAAAADKRRRRKAVDLAFKSYSRRFHAPCMAPGWAALIERTLRFTSGRCWGTRRCRRSPARM